MKTINRSIKSNTGGLRYTIQNKKVKRSKVNNSILTPTEFNSIEKLGLNPVDYAFEDICVLLKIKADSYEYMKLTDNEITTFIDVLKGFINDEAYLISDEQYQLLVSAGFDIKTEVMLKNDITVTINDEQEIVLTNKDIDAKLLKKLDTKFTTKRHLVTTYNKTNLNISINNNNKTVKFGCKTLTFDTLLSTFDEIEKDVKFVQNDETN
jgi:hypothetical protein